MEFKSVYVGYADYSFVITWQMRTTIGRAETLSCSYAKKLCADLKRDYPASCHKIDCKTGKNIEKIA